jgi:transcriptional regulator with XRE-family HTH domain
MIAESAPAPYKADMLTPDQIRAARALLGWKQSDLASASGVSTVAVKNIEAGRSDARGSTLAKLEKAFNEAGVILLEPGDRRDGGRGVRYSR